MNFDKHRFRCSELGKIWSSDGELTVANKTYLLEVFIEKTTGKRKDISSKYFEKGSFNEEDGLEMLNNMLYPESLVLKNKERKFNDFIEGECDTIHDRMIYDIKNAWDRFTFGKAKLSNDYEQQGRGYMWLWNLKTFRLFYCINNMPEHMLQDEERKLFYQHTFLSTADPDYLALCEELRAYHTYDDMRPEERFKIWQIEHDDSFIEKMKAKILKCRKYLNKLQTESEEQLAFNRGLMNPKKVLATT